MNCPVCQVKLEREFLDLPADRTKVRRDDVVTWQLTIPNKGTVRVCGHCFLLTNILDELKKINLHFRESEECQTLKT